MPERQLDRPPAEERIPAFVNAAWKRVALLLVAALVASAAILLVRQPGASDRYSAGPPGRHREPTPVPSHAPDSVLQLQPVVLATYEHDPTAFTQGLLYHDGKLYESTGLYGASTLREVDPESGEVLRSRNLAPERFGEGLALVGQRLVQLTWRAREGYIYDLQSLERTGAFQYPTEGWGLCYDGQALVLSDGTDRLYRLDPDTFEVLDSLAVSIGGVPIDNLNELECVGEDVYANVWQTDTILRIDGDTGQVEAKIDASGLLSPDEANQADVLNGIARIPESESFLITGKHWPKMFEVRFVPEQDLTP